MNNEHKSFLKDVFGVSRTARLTSVSAGILLLLLVVLIALNSLTGLLPATVNSLNFSGEDTFVLTNAAKKMLSTLNEPVRIIYFTDGGKTSADPDLSYFFSQIEETSDKITVDILSPDSTEALLLLPAETEIESDSVLVKSEKRYKMLSLDELYYYYNPNVGVNLSAAEYRSYLESFVSAYQTTGQQDTSSVGYVLYSTADETEVHFDGASKLVNALRFVTAENVPMITVVSTVGMDESLLATLSLNCFGVTEQLDLSSVPADTSLLVLYAPAADLTEAEETVLRGYLASGGKMILSTLYSSVSFPRLSAVLADYGLAFDTKVHFLCEGNSSYLLSSNYPYYILCHTDSDYPASAGLTSPVVALMAHRILVSDTLPEGVTVTPVLYTSEAGYYCYQDGNKTAVSTDKAVYNIGVSAACGESEIFWFSSPLSLSASLNSTSGNANFTFFLSLCNHLCGTDAQSVTLDSTQIITDTVSVSAVTVLIFAVLLVLLIPAAVLGAGIVYRSVRKRR